MSCQDVTKVTGEHLLFLGTSTAGWSIQQFQQAAQFAKAHGVDSLLVKVADGTSLWSGGIIGYRPVSDIIKSVGVGCIPYTYSYGNTYNSLDAEIGILQSFMAEDGIVCADMETEWNGQVSWASYLASKIHPTPGVFLVSTWADPNLQNWQSVLGALSPCVDAYMPQQYDDFLVSCWGQFNGACLQPTLEMTQDVGPNNVVVNAKVAHDRGSSAISIWHYGTAIQNPGLLDQILAQFPKSIQPPEEQPVTIDLTNGAVANFFNGDTKTWTCIKTGFTLHADILAFYQGFGGNDLCGLTHLGLPPSSEIPVNGRPGLVPQQFERVVLIFHPDHVISYPPGADRVYTLQISSGLGQDPQIATLQGEIAKLQSLPIVANMQQIQTVGQSIKNDVDTIMKLAQVQ